MCSLCVSPKPCARSRGLPVVAHTRWADEDKVAVLNNAVFLNLLEEGRFQYFKHLGLLEKPIGFGFLLGQTNIRFLSPGHGPATVTIEITTTRIGNKSFDQAYRLLGPRGTVWAEAQTILVWWDAKSRSTIETPGIFLKAYASKFQS